MIWWWLGFALFVGWLGFLLGESLEELDAPSEGIYWRDR